MARREGNDLHLVEKGHSQDKEEKHQKNNDGGVVVTVASLWTVGDNVAHFRLRGLSSAHTTVIRFIDESPSESLDSAAARL